MAKKMRAASTETQFLRGDVGADGAATSEARDEGEKEQAGAREALLRGRTWLGREALTWLLFRSESTEPVVHVDRKPLSVLFTGKIVLRAAGGEIVELSAKGVAGPYSQLVKQALATGLLVHGARLQFTHGDDVYEATVDAENFDIRSAKLPVLLQEEESDRIAERLELTTRLSKLVDACVEKFVDARVDRTWQTKISSAMKEWMAPKTPTGWAPADRNSKRSTDRSSQPA